MAFSNAMLYPHRPSVSAPSHGCGVASLSLSWLPPVSAGMHALLTDRSQSVLSGIQFNDGLWVRDDARSSYHYHGDVIMGGYAQRIQCQIVSTNNAHQLLIHQLGDGGNPSIQRQVTLESMGADAHIPHFSSDTVQNVLTPLFADYLVHKQGRLYQSLLPLISVALHASHGDSPLPQSALLSLKQFINRHYPSHDKDSVQDTCQMTPQQASAKLRGMLAEIDQIAGATQRLLPGHCAPYFDSIALTRVEHTAADASAVHTSDHEQVYPSGSPRAIYLLGTTDMVSSTTYQEDAERREKRLDRQLSERTDQTNGFGSINGIQVG